MGKKTEKFVYVDMENKQIININIPNCNHNGISSITSHGVFANNFTLSSKAYQYFMKHKSNEKDQDIFDQSSFNKNQKYSAFITEKSIYFF